MEGVGNNCVAATTAGGAEVVKSLQVPALALPIADGEINKG